jgi:acetolactate synthase small subunit
MNHRRLQTYADFGVDVVEISSSEWRVSLTNGDEADPSSLLGFVQQIDGMFEVTEICRPGKRTYHRQFEAALAQLRTAPPLNHVLEDTTA